MSKLLGSPTLRKEILFLEKSSFGNKLSFLIAVLLVVRLEDLPPPSNNGQNIIALNERHAGVNGA